MTKALHIDDIERYAGLAGIRAKPTMYVGTMDSYALWTIGREPADNIVDQALAGRCSSGHLIFTDDINYIIDDGLGIPVESKEFKNERGKVEKLSGLYVVTGLLHAGSNFSSKNVSRGTHGVGIKATNALSSYFQVWTYRKGKWYSILYKKGTLIKDVHIAKPPRLPHGIKLPKQGTIIAYTPDKELFKKHKMFFGAAHDWADLTSYLVPKLDLKITVPTGKTTSYKVKDIKEYFVKRIREFGYHIRKEKGEEQEQLLHKPFIHRGKMSDVMVQWCTPTGDNIKCYTNGLYNADGGEHQKAFYAALKAALNEYTTGKQTFGVAELKEGILGLVNAKLAAPVFNNQVKERLVDGRVYKEFHDEVYPALVAFFKANKSMAKDIVKRACDFGALTDKFKASKKLISDVNKAGKKHNPKLADCIGNAPPDKREIFLVEGDSAAGGAKRARDKQTQAVFPLRGKPLNVMEATADKINGNAEIVNILAAIGADLSKDVVTTRYGKVIIMADADVDGFHIACLCLGLFWKFTPSLYKKGAIHILNGPRYKVTLKDNVYFGDNKERLRKKYGDKATITYLKGWGEVDEEHLKHLCFQPGRKLTQIQYPKSKQDIKNFESLLGKDVNYRKQLLNILRAA